MFIITIHNFETKIENLWKITKKNYLILFGKYYL